MPAYVLQSAFHWHFSLVSNGDNAFIDFSVVNYFCWASPTRWIFVGLKSMIVNQFTDFVIVLLCCNSGFRVQSPLDFLRSCALKGLLQGDFSKSVRMSNGTRLFVFVQHMDVWQHIWRSSIDIHIGSATVDCYQTVSGKYCFSQNLWKRNLETFQFTLLDYSVDNVS